MDKDMVIICITVLCAIAMVLFTPIYLSYRENIIAIEKGLQECLIPGSTAKHWAKECSDATVKQTKE